MEEPASAPTLHDHPPPAKRFQNRQMGTKILPMTHPMIFEGTRLPHGIHAERDDLVAEFMAKPFGRHTPDLQALLAHMRGGSIYGKYFLLMTRSHAEWTLARFSNSSPLRAELVDDAIFDDIEDAERHVFLLRWKALFGSLPTDSSSSST